MAEGKLKKTIQALEKAKAQVRVYVEHPFDVVKNLFKHRKVRYRSLAKNIAQLHKLFALANLVLIQRNLRPEARIQTASPRQKNGPHKTQVIDANAPNLRSASFTDPAILNHRFNQRFPKTKF